MARPLQSFASSLRVERSNPDFSGRHASRRALRALLGMRQVLVSVP
jgi:hypothetical protein